MGEEAAASAIVEAVMQEPNGIGDSGENATRFVFGGGNGIPVVSSEPISAENDQSILLIDSFMFNGDIAAEVRLNATAHFFDLVIVVEAWEPLAVASPRKTQLYSKTRYWREVFARFGSKVRLVEVCRSIDHVAPGCSKKRAEAYLHVFTAYRHPATVAVLLCTSHFAGSQLPSNASVLDCVLDDKQV